MGKSVCIDASLALTWLLPTQQSDAANALRQEWDRAEVQLVSPPLFHAEVTSVLREQVYFQKLLPEEGEEAFSIYLDMGVKSLNSPDVIRKAWELAREFNMPRTYDMQYMAVAVLEDCEFWTGDRRLANSLQDKVDRVKWVGEYNQKR